MFRMLLHVYAHTKNMCVRVCMYVCNRTVHGCKYSCACIDMKMKINACAGANVCVCIWCGVASSLRAISSCNLT